MHVENDTMVSTEKDEENARAAYEAYLGIMRRFRNCAPFDALTDEERLAWFAVANALAWDGVGV